MVGDVMTTPDPLRGNGHVVDSLGHALRSGEHGLSTVPGLLKRVLVEGSWREFVTQRGEHVEHQRFAEFVATQPLRGLGATVRLVQKVVDAIEDLAERATVQDLLDRALQNPASVHAGNNIPGRPEGTSKDKALRRLRKDAPDLHAEVLAGRLTAHAAMVQAGFRRPTFTVRADSAESIAATLRRHIDPAVLANVIRLIEAEGGTA